MTKGIHHITAIASSAQNNVDFYTKILGLRLVKKTVNQDDTETYHLFYGDTLGHPGMDLTFFIFQPPSQGMRGNGLVTTISFAVPTGSLDYWKSHFKKNGVSSMEPTSYLGRKRMVFYDEDDQQLELVEVPEKELDSTHIWTNVISKDYAIRNFHSATLNVHDLQAIEPVLTTVLGYEKIKEEGERVLYTTPESGRASHIEVIEDPTIDFGINAAGTVHHIAFRAENTEEQAEMSTKVMRLGIPTTDVIDRYYFKSVYFRTPAGILFEIATDKPGFTADEKEAELGKHLALPPFLEKQRSEIEAHLPDLEIK